MPVLQAEDVAQTMLDASQIVAVGCPQDTFDDSFFDRQQIRESRCAGVKQAHAFPIAEWVIASSRFAEEARLAADRAHYQVRQTAVKRICAEHQRRAGLGATLPRERNVYDHHLPSLIGSRRGHRLRLPKPG
jgi:hypothetical protein